MNEGNNIRLISTLGQHITKVMLQKCVLLLFKTNCSLFLAFIEFQNRGSQHYPGPTLLMHLFTIIGHQLNIYYVNTIIQNLGYEGNKVHTIYVWISSKIYKYVRKKYENIKSSLPHMIRIIPCKTCNIWIFVHIFYNMWDTRGGFFWMRDGKTQNTLKYEN